MYQLKYDVQKGVLSQIAPDGNESVLTNDSSSVPEYSADAKNAIYISPLEWECMGSLFLNNLETGQVKELVEPDNHSYIPKYAIWINDHTLALMIGYAHGTVNVGGNIHTYNLLTDKMQQITHYPEDIQVTKLSLNGGRLVLEGIKYIDEHLNEFEQFKDELSL